MLFSNFSAGILGAILAILGCLATMVDGIVQEQHLGRFNKDRHQGKQLILHKGVNSGFRSRRGDHPSVRRYS